MSKDKVKSGTGGGTGKKGWTRWQAGVKKAKAAKPYVSKGTKKSGSANAGSDSNGDTSKK